MDTIEINAEQRIIEAARQVFLKKGYSGARMQEIADAAGFNKALVHYYFRSKERLFEVIFKESFSKILPTLTDIFKSGDTLFQKIEKFTSGYISLVLEHPYIPVFVLSEMHRNPDSFFQNFLPPELKSGIQKIMFQFEEATRKGEIIAIEPRQLIINIMSLCVFPFVARPMLQRVISADDEAYEILQQERVRLVSKFIINAITPKSTI